MRPERKIQSTLGQAKDQSAAEIGDFRLKIAD
jgi:hypothetical protein